MTNDGFNNLIDRLLASPNQDRNLDAMIHVELFKPRQAPDDHRYYRLPHISVDHMDMCAPGTYWLTERSGRSLHTAPYYTGIVDHERLVLLLKILREAL